MASVVVMPVCHRPELLALALEKLDQARKPENLDVRIYADTSADLESIECVRDVYYPEALIFQANPHIQAPSGCWNILNAIKSGYRTGADYIFLIEEDVLIKPDFFTFHLSQTDCLASCGRKDRRHYLLYPDLYTNPGSCLHRELVEQLIPHICDDYFTRLREYMDEHFGSWDTQSHLDDGLIRRVIRQMGGRAVYPDIPVCAHQGFRAYNKLDIYMNYEISIEEKIKRLREMLRTVKPTDRYTGDFDTF